MATAHSSRKRPRGRDRRSPSASESPPDSPQGEFQTLLGRFNEGLALVETANMSLDNAAEREERIGNALVTLDRGITELNRVYDDLDMAILKAFPGTGPKEEPAS